MPEVLADLHCACCDKKLSTTQPLFSTAWSGVHWCGDDECAIAIMEDHSVAFDPDDKINYEWED